MSNSSAETKDALDELREVARVLGALPAELRFYPTAIPSMGILKMLDIVERGATEIQQLRAALQGLMPFCAEDFPPDRADLPRACVAPAYLKAYEAALDVLRDWRRV